MAEIFVRIYVYFTAHRRCDHKNINVKSISRIVIETFTKATCPNFYSIATFLYSFNHVVFYIWTVQREYNIHHCRHDRISIWLYQYVEPHDESQDKIIALYTFRHSVLSQVFKILSTFVLRHEQTKLSWLQILPVT